MYRVIFNYLQKLNVNHNFMAPKTDKKRKCICSDLWMSLYNFIFLIMSISIADRTLLIKLHYSSGETVQQTIRSYFTVKNIKD